MQTKIFISVRPHQTRIVQTKENDIITYKVQNKNHVGFVGSIYVGRVSKILPGMGACFVDIGEKREGFLHSKDLVSDKKQTEPIQKILHTGQLILVQVMKDSIKSKTYQLSMAISLTSANLVYMPQFEGVGISRQITDEKERDRLEALATKLDLPGKIIVRTKAKGTSDLTKDAKYLLKKWEDIESQRRKSPGLVLKEISLEYQMLRDELNHPKSQVWIDHKKTFEKAKKFLTQYMSNFKQNVHFYNKTQPLFEKLGIEKKLKNALKRTLYLKSGGAIVIDETEAMISIDVNTGKFIGKKDQEKNNIKNKLGSYKRSHFTNKNKKPWRNYCY